MNYILHNMLALMIIHHYVASIYHLRLRKTKWHKFVLLKNRIRYYGTGNLNLLVQYGTCTNFFF